MGAHIQDKIFSNVQGVKGQVMQDARQVHIPARLHLAQFMDIAVHGQVVFGLDATVVFNIPLNLGEA